MIMTKPCDNCTTNIDQAINYDEVTCFQTCNKFKQWQSSREEKPCPYHLDKIHCANCFFEDKCEARIKV